MNLGYCYKCKTQLTDYSQFEVRAGKKLCKDCLGITKGTKPSNKEYDDLIEYIKHLFGLTEVPLGWLSYIDKQFKAGKRYSGIQGTLYYFYEIKENDRKFNDSAIGIVEYAYLEAERFFAELEAVREHNRTVELKEETRVVSIRRDKSRTSEINIEEL